MGASGGATEAVMELSLDPDIYDAAMLTATGITATAPAPSIGIVSVTVAQAARSNRAALLKLTCYQGTDFDTATDTRAVEVLCELSKIATAITALVSQSIVLGIGATAKSWKIGRVR